MEFVKQNAQILRNSISQAVNSMTMSDPETRAPKYMALSFVATRQPCNCIEPKLSMTENLV